MNDKIGDKIEVYSLSELKRLQDGLKYFACIGGSKNFECFLESNSLSRADFMKKYSDRLDKCHIPIYEDNDIVIRQDAQIAIPGFYIVATKNNYKNISQMDLELYQKCLFFVSYVEATLKNLFGIDRIYQYYDEHYNKPSSTHFWVMPVYNSIVKENGLNATILSRDIWKYQELFDFCNTKTEIYRINDGMRKMLKKEL